MAPRRILILAGEQSGDTHGAGVARELRQRWPDVELVGLGGRRMAEEGVSILHGLDELAVMGFAEVVGRLPFFRRLERKLGDMIASGRYDLVLPIDYPGLNLRIAAIAKRHDVPVLYYIGPQVWAWKAHRAAKLARIADHIALILPFEPDLYRAHGGKAEFVGHPLLDETAPAFADQGEEIEFRGDLGLEPGQPLLALFPGSRRQEIARHLKPFTEAAADLQRRVPELGIVIGKAQALPDDIFAGSPFPLTERVEQLRATATAGLVKSGTSTLEAALAGLPFVVAYVTNPVTYAMARRLVRVPHIALANLVAGERVVPEYVQDQVRAQPLADALEPLLVNSEARQTMISALGRVRQRLGSPGAAARVASLVETVLRQRAAASA